MNESTSAAEKRTEFHNHGGGHFHCFQKSELFVACLSGFWFREMLLGRLEQKMFPAETKKMRE
jgi:hypothetical protein